MACRSPHAGVDTLIVVASSDPGVVSDDPTAISVLAVTTDDVVTALEANERRDASAVLRVTPPFSGRMRARLHLDGAEDDYGDPAPIHLSPERFLDRVPAFPAPDDTEDEIRSDPDATYSPDEHRRRHEAAVEAWRRSVRASMLEGTTVPTPDGPHSVRVTTLG